jgi:hypothetical protein
MIHIIQITVVYDPLRPEENYGLRFDEVTCEELFTEGFSAGVILSDGTLYNFRMNEDGIWTCTHQIDQDDDEPLVELEFKYDGTFFKALDRLLTKKNFPLVSTYCHIN